MHAVSVGFATGWIVLDRVIVAEARSMARSIVRFAPVQCIERKQDSASLVPKGCFIPAESIKREIGQVGETQKTARELDSGNVGFRPRVGRPFYITYSIA